MPATLAQSYRPMPLTPLCVDSQQADNEHIINHTMKGKPHVRRY
ncbi:hypothetical protein [Undibacterium hunanense]|nr:hypothetical protein [Undibacterium hunanense]